MIQATTTLTRAEKSTAKRMSLDFNDGILIHNEQVLIISDCQLSGLSIV